MAANRGVTPPIPTLRAAGCTIANGTDNNTNDMFEVMRMAMLTERILRGDDPIPGMMPQPEDVLEDATLGSARRCGSQTTVGSLEVGKKADILVLDTQRIHLVPSVRIVSAWIHNGQPSDIESVMIDGQLRDARPQDPHRGRGGGHCRGRQGGTKGLGRGAEERARSSSRAARASDSVTPRRPSPCW